jgi:hypothetical protein
MKPDFSYSFDKPIVTKVLVHNSSSTSGMSKLLVDMIHLKVKFTLRTGHEGPDGGYRYTSTVPLTSAPDWGGWSMPHPGCFTPRKETRYPSYSRLGGPQGQFRWAQKILLPPGFDPRTVQPVASCYPAP